MKLAGILALLLTPILACATAWDDLLVADKEPSKRGGVRITYLGTNGYLLEGAGTALLIDPYFTRISLSAAALNLPVRSNPARIESALQHLPRKVDAILVTHGHFDHLLDVPPIARRTGAKILASQSSVFLANAAGALRGRAIPMRYGQSRRIGAAKITALLASHDRIFGCCVPFPGTLKAPSAEPPTRPRDWVCGEPLSFLIELGGRRIYLDSGGTPNVLPDAVIRPIDVAIIGVALPDARKRLPAMLERLRPRYFLPSHQDDFFRPMGRRFVFGKMTDFCGVVRTAQRSRTRLIVLDYFRPWTLN